VKGLLLQVKEEEEEEEVYLQVHTYDFSFI
jgi:hypothetical protein